MGGILGCIGVKYMVLNRVIGGNYMMHDFHVFMPVFGSFLESWSFKNLIAQGISAFSY